MSKDSTGEGINEINIKRIKSQRQTHTFNRVRNSRQIVHLGIAKEKVKMYCI